MTNLEYAKAIKKSWQTCDGHWEDYINDCGPSQPLWELSDEEMEQLENDFVVWEAHLYAGKDNVEEILDIYKELA